MKFWYLLLLPSIIFLYKAGQVRAQTSAPRKYNELYIVLLYFYLWVLNLLITSHNLKKKIF